MRRGVLLALVVVLAACQRRPVHDTARKATLGGDTAATVGGTRIPVSLVGAVAGAEHIAPRVALDRIIDDALAYQGALAEGADRDPAMHWALESAVARATATHIKETTTAAGPPTDAEVAATTARYWSDFDHGEEVRTIHALVERPKEAARTDAARALAGQLLAAEAGAKSDDDFEARAKAVPHDAFDVKVERLPLFVADGRIVGADPGHPMDPTFTRAAFTLTHPGEQTGLVETPFGWHVIRLIERLPPKVVPLEERRVTFAPEILAVRGHDALTALLAARKAATRIEIQPAAGELMAEAAPSVPSSGEP